MMKSRIVRLLSAVIIGSLIIMPVSAAPEVDDLKGKKQAAQSEVDSLESQLTEIIGKIDSLERELIKTGEDITAATEDLKKAQELEKEQYEAMKLRIRYMYEQGDSSAVEALLSAKDFSELINKAEYVQKVHKYDREKLEEYVATKNKIAKLKTRLEKDQANIVKAQSEYESEEDSLNTLVEEKQGEVENLDGQIQAAIEEAARKAEEEERRQAEEERQAQEDNAGTDEADDDSDDSNRDDSDNGGNDSDNDDDGDDANDNSDDEKEDSDDNSSSGIDSGSVVVNRAYGKLGSPYKWGAVGPNSFDCSGFVSYCLTGEYKRIGTSGTFAGWPKVSNPQPGDVCVKSGHVGIYIGGGKMIHAPSRGDVVKISKVHSGMWYVRK